MKKRVPGAPGICADRGVLAAPGLLATLGVVACAPAGGPEPLLVERAVGIDFTHETGARGKHELPETMGGGVALIDSDQDGDLDVYLVQSGPMRPRRGSKEGLPRNVLFANDGRGRFQEVPDGGGAADRSYGMGVAVGDYDGDGRDDLALLNWGPNGFFRDAGASYERQRAAALGLEERDDWSVSAAFFDAEGDGDLDLYVVNYLEYAPGEYRRLGEPEGFAGYPHPDRFSGASDRFLLNDGRGAFADRTEEAGLWRPSGKGLGVVPTDVDLDGRVDLYVANDSTPNFLYVNASGPEGVRFREEGVALGAAYNDDGRSEAGMGVDTADVDGDGHFDLISTHLDFETHTLYRRRPAGGFFDATRQSGLSLATRMRVGFGALFADVDLDGRRDLLVCNGHILENVAEVSELRTYAQPDDLFLGDGEGGLRLASAEEAGAWSRLATVGRGSASGDLDGDGHLDFVLATSGGPARVLFGNPPRRPALLLSLEGPPGNPRGLGASVWLEDEAGGRRLFRVEAARSYASASAPVVATGLPVPLVAVEVLWPGGARERFEAAGLEGRHSLGYGRGEPVD